MPAGRLYLELGLAPADALARGRATLELLTDERPVVAYGAELNSASIALGAYQHAPHALRWEALAALALPVLRRTTGGGALWLSPGVLYLALALRDASTLMACPPGRILNRNVRGLLAGLRGLAVPAFYFGRDFVSVGPGPGPGVFVGWDEDGEGRVLLECFVAHETSFELPQGVDGYPARAQPPWGGKPITTLSAVAPRRLAAEEVLQALASGYERAFGVHFERDLERRALSVVPPVPSQLRPELDPVRGLVWSSPHAEAIGFVSAGVRLDEDGRVGALELGGDFFQQRTCATALAERLLGANADAESIGAAIDAVYAARPGRIEGVRSLTTLRDALLEAAARARG